jgi:hypothetical protein
MFSFMQWQGNFHWRKMDVPLRSAIATSNGTFMHLLPIETILTTNIHYLHNIAHTCNLVLRTRNGQQLPLKRNQKPNVEGKAFLENVSKQNELFTLENVSIGLNYNICVVS